MRTGWHEVAVLRLWEPSRSSLGAKSFTGCRLVDLRMAFHRSWTSSFAYVDTSTRWYHKPSGFLIICLGSYHPQESQKHKKLIFHLEGSIEDLHLHFLWFDRKTFECSESESEVCQKDIGLVLSIYVFKGSEFETFGVRERSDEASHST